MIIIYFSDTLHRLFAYVHKLSVQVVNILEIRGYRLIRQLIAKNDRFIYEMLCYLLPDITEKSLAFRAFGRYNYL